MARRIARALLCLALLACALPSRADEPSARTRAQVKRYIKRARASYQAGKLDDAVRDYQAAYQLLPVADIQFNIGQIERVKGDRVASIAAYQHYLADAPDGGHADEAKSQVATLTRELVPAALGDKYDAVKKQMSGKAGQDPALAQKWQTLNGTIASGDTQNLDAQLDALSADIDATLHPKPRLDTARAAAQVVAESPPPRPAHSEKKPLLKTWWFWTAVGGGAALVVTAIVLGAVLGSHTVDPMPTIGVLK